MNYWKTLPFIYYCMITILKLCNKKNLVQIPKCTMGSQNGLFGQYPGNEKRYDPKTMLHPKRCGYSASVKVFLGHLSPNWAQVTAKTASLVNILGNGNRERYELETMLYPLNVIILRCNDGHWALYLVWKPRYSHLKFEPMGLKMGLKRGFPEVNFGGLFWGASMTYELPKKFPDLLHNLVHIHPLLVGDCHFTCDFF